MRKILAVFDVVSHTLAYGEDIPQSKTVRDAPGLSAIGKTGRRIILAWALFHIVISLYFRKKNNTVPKHKAKVLQLALPLRRIVPSREASFRVFNL